MNIYSKINCPYLSYKIYNIFYLTYGFLFCRKIDLPYYFLDHSLKSSLGLDKFVTILLYGVAITIPQNLVSLVKTFGIAALLGLSVYSSFQIYPETTALFTNIDDLNDYLSIDLNTLNIYRRQISDVAAELYNQITELQLLNARFLYITSQWSFIIPPDWNVPDWTGLQHTIRLGPGTGSWPGSLDVGLNRARPFLWELWDIRERFLDLERSIEALYVRGFEIERLLDEMYRGHFHPWGGRMSPYVEITNGMTRPFGVYTTRGLPLWEGRGIADS